MPPPPSRRLWWFRLLERLGFRWVFPIGTLAVPVHPVLVRALPWVPVALLTYAAARTIGGLDGGIAPWSLLLVAALLAVPLSVPVLNYALFAFRVPLLQGGLVTAAMALIAVDVVAGRMAWGWAAVPAAYSGSFLVLAIGGRLAVLRLRHGERVVARVAGRDGVEVTGPHRREAAHWLLAHTGVTVVGIDEAAWVRPDPAALARARELMAQERSDYRAEGDLLIVPWAPPVAASVRERALGRGLRLLVGDDVAIWEVTDGSTEQRLMSGTPQLVGRLPVWVCFYFPALFGGRSRWVVGFPRTRGHSLGDTAKVLGRVFRKRPDPPEYADVSASLEYLEGVLTERRQRYLRLLEELGRREARSVTWDALADVRNVSPAAVAGTGVTLCDLVDRAKEEHGWHLAAGAAVALSRLPAEELRSLTPRVLRITGSRILSLQWRLTPDLDVTPLPRNLPRFGDVAGFGLLDRAPWLYERLGELDDPRVLEVLDGLAAEAGWVRPLERAREEYRRRHA